MAELAGFLDYTAIARSIASATARGTGEGVSKAVQKQLDKYGAAFSDKSLADPLFAEANKRLAFNMKTAVLHSYDQVVTGQKRVSSYRQGAPGRDAEGAQLRYSGGALRNALQNDKNYIATAQGIKFIDLDFMDQKAEHWYRLNFGAAPQAGRAPYAFNWEIDGQSLGQLQLSWAPSAPFRMPHGVWREGAFYPKGRRLQTPTRGIGARRFLDAGLDRFSKDFPTVYGDLQKQYFKQAESRVQNPSPTTVNVRAT